MVICFYFIVPLLFLQGLQGFAGEPGMDGPTGSPVSFLFSYYHNTLRAVLAVQALPSHLAANLYEYQ